MALVKTILDRLNFSKLYKKQMKKSTFKSKKRAIEAVGKEVSDWTLIDWLKASESGAEIHIQALAEAMWDACRESTPKELKAGGWHIPFGDKVNEIAIAKLCSYAPVSSNIPEFLKEFEETLLKISVARAARLSYMTMDGKIDYEKDIQLYNTLLENGHLSPFEHCAKAVDTNAKPFYEIEGATHEDVEGNTWSGNFKSWIQYRQLIEQKQA